MRTMTFVGLLVLGVAAGFGAVAGFLRLGKVDTGPLDLTASLQADKGWIASPGEGWGPTSRRGTVLAASHATLEVPLPAKLEGPIVIDIVARPEPLTARAGLSLSVNGSALGAWMLKEPRTKRLLLQSSAAGAKQVLLMQLGTDKPGGAIIEEIRLLDFRRLDDFRGHVDGCRGAAVEGWAAAGDAPSPVLIYRDGKLAQTFLPDLVRGDLKKVTQAFDAGFRLALSPPIRAGERVELRFPNGRPIRGVGCAA